MLGRLWWTPLAFAILALLLLVVTPIIVDRRVAAIRNALTNGSEHARVLLNDLEAAFASQAVGRDSAARQDTLAIATRAHFITDQDELRVTVHSISPEAIRRFNELSVLLYAWEENEHTPGSDSVSMVRARAILASAEAFDGYLASVSISLRRRAGRLERLDVVSAAILAPIALIAMLIVLWAGGRVLTFARAVDLERAAVIRSTEARAALLRGVTHDVKNPLGAALGFAQLLEEGVVGPMPPPQLDLIKRVRRLVNSSVEIVSDLLEVARADGGELHVELAETDLGALATEVLEDHDGMAREHGIVVTLDAAPTRLVTDSARARRILTNLLSNAIKYTPNGGRVAIRIVRSTPPDTPKVGVEVADSGPGIPPELRSRVFEEFFRVSGDGHAQGNGLGLAISRRLARLLGGDIVLRENDGGGSVFTFWLPRPRDSA